MSTSLATVLSERLPRMFAAGVDHNDVQRLLASVHDMADWPLQWERLANGYQALGEEALARAALVSAGEAFARQALYCHFGQFAYFADPEIKRRLQRSQNQAYLRAAPYLSPPAEHLRIDAGTYEMAAVLRIPHADRPPPCVVLVPGADSTKEEFQTLESVFHRRGLATCSVDGPGQGLTWLQARLLPDFETPVGHVLDHLCRRQDIDSGRLGVWGRSFGAYAALRAAVDRRVSAVVSIGGFYDLAGVWSRMPRSTQESIAYAMGADTPEAAVPEIGRYSLRGHLADVRCPVLIVHSGGDQVCPVQESERMVAELSTPTTYRLFEEGNHVCDNIPFTVRPFMGDWLAEQLSDTSNHYAGLKP